MTRLVKLPVPSSESSTLVIESGCDSSVAIRDLVYVYGADEVRKASASDISTAKTIGFVNEKSTSTTCKIITSGVISGFTNLIANKVYFLSETAGGITTTAPTTSGSVVTQVGIALNQTQMLVRLSYVYTKRS